MVTVLVCTRNRPAQLAAAVRGLLASEGVELELIVIGQSDGTSAAADAPALSSDSRLRHVPSRSQGKGAALNEGLRLARGNIVVCTDDDCEAPRTWVAAMARALERQPSAAIAFCNVTAPPYDKNTGYVPAYERQRSRLLRSIVATCAGHGLGAGMALRREAILELGGFDEMIGPGARFPSGDDWDITARALLCGWHVYEAADVSILHNGFRTFEEGRNHVRRDWIAIGAVCAKPLRAGRFSAVVVPLWEFTAHAVWPPLMDLLQLRRPRGRARIVGFLLGFAHGLRTPVDPKTLTFAPRS